MRRLYLIHVVLLLNTDGPRKPCQTLLSKPYSMPGRWNAIVRVSHATCLLSHVPAHVSVLSLTSWFRNLRSLSLTLPFLLRSFISDAAERHLYREVLPALEQIRQAHPSVIIGAVTDGKANPLFMTFTLAKYFDFCISWEDDQSGRKKFFHDLANVEGRAELKWIYDAALEKYQELSAAQWALQGGAGGAATNSGTAGGGGDAGSSSSSPSSSSPNRIWIHVGDDLAYDIGGSFQSGAKTIWLELDEERYRQTARQRFAPHKIEAQPSWSTSTRQELEKRRVMNELALQFVDKRVQFISRLPEAIQEIIDEANEDVEAAAAAAAQVAMEESVNGRVSNAKPV